MTQKDPNTDRAQSSSPLIPTEIAALGKKHIEELVNAQAEILEKVQETNQHWFDRLQSEANLASELASKLTTARSIPDAMTAYQEWSSRHIEMMAEDGKHLLADIMQAGPRLLSSGLGLGTRQRRYIG